MASEVSSKRVAVCDTMTTTGAEVVVFPAASRATAVKVREPLAAVVVSQSTEYGAVVSSAPMAAPSTKNCTPTTPTLSEAEAVTVVVPARTTPDAGDVRATVGGVLSLNTVTVTGSEVQRTPSA